MHMGQGGAGGGMEGTGLGGHEEEREAWWGYFGGFSAWVACPPA